ncbi:TPA: hypothetical protein ACHHIW_002706 [Staphylococcus aureus]
MASFSIKKLETTEPLNLYSDLDKSVEFGEDYATSTQEDELHGKIYYLGGLEAYNLNTAGLSEETIARFNNALDAGNIDYAVFPNDKRNGRLPLVLNKKTRAFLETMPELITNREVDWYLYKLPGDIDPDNNERRGSEFVKDSNEKEIKLRYEEVAEHIANSGFVKPQEQEEDLFVSEEEEDKSEETTTSSDNQDEVAKEPKKQNEETKSNTTTEVNTDSENNEKESQMSDFEKMMHEDEFDDEGEDKEDEVNYNEVFAEPKEDSVNSLSFNSHQNTVEENESKNTSTPNDNDQFDVANISNQPVSKENQNGDSIDSERTLISNRTKQYIQLPSIVKEIINNISLPKFTDYPTNGVYEVTTNTMQKEISDSNQRIKSIEDSIKREAEQLYRDHMYQSYLAITSELDTETGNENVIAFYQKYKQRKAELDRQFDEEVQNEKKNLEEKFYGEPYEKYKEEIIAQIEKWYKDERYEKDVTEPLNEFSKNRKDEYENRKLDETTDYNEWLHKVETTAIGQDQQEAIKQMTLFIKNKSNEALNHIEKLQRRMDQVNQSLAQIEYQERANEHIRKNFGTDLEQDEQAKIYKRKLDTAIEDKAQLDAAFKKFEAETKEQKKEIDDNHKKEVEKLNKDHSDLIKKLNDEKENLEKDNREKEEAATLAKKNSDDNAKKTGFKFAGIATLATAVVIGGCSMVTNHAKESDNNHKIEQQQKQLKQTNKKLDDQEKQLKDKDNEIQKQKEEVKKAQDEAKKSSDKKTKK